jgi:hypothetical protein
MAQIGRDCDFLLRNCGKLWRALVVLGHIWKTGTQGNATT